MKSTKALGLGIGSGAAVVIAVGVMLSETAMGDEGVDKVLALEHIKSAMNAVVELYDTPPNSKRQDIATAFVVGKQDDALLFLTNYHCVESLLKRGLHKVHAEPLNGRESIEADIVYFDKDRDLALLTATTSSAKHYSKLLLVEPNRAPRTPFCCFAIGYPSGTPGLISTVAKSGEVTLYKRWYLLLKDVSRGGQSGSPVLSSSGRVVGVWYGRRGQDGLAISYRSIHDFRRNYERHRSEMEARYKQSQDECAVQLLKQLEWTATGPWGRLFPVLRWNVDRREFVADETR